MVFRPTLVSVGINSLLRCVKEVNNQVDLSSATRKTIRSSFKRLLVLIGLIVDFCCNKNIFVDLIPTRILFL